MKLPILTFSKWLCGCSAALLCLATSAAQTPGKTAAPAGTKPEAATEQEVPRSLFTIPTTPKEGRDPFYPSSTLGFPNANVTRTNNTVAAAPPRMSLMGISGTREKPLAIINGRTFGKGEDQEVPSPNGKLRVKCVEIKEDSVIIDVNGERQELRLRHGL